jgi:murein DD-endopeptidase MepM/ murein hydrolase activator NlpD
MKNTMRPAVLLCVLLLAAPAGAQEHEPATAPAPETAAASAEPTVRPAAGSATDAPSKPEAEAGDSDTESDAALRWLSGEQKDSTRALPPARLGTAQKPRTLQRTAAQATGPVVTRPRLVARAPAKDAVEPGAARVETTIVRKTALPSPKTKTKPVAKASKGHFVFRWPVKNVRVTSRYGIRRDPKKRKKRRMHKGTDLGGRKGTAVLATGPGTILFAGRGRGGVGICIVIRHPDGWVSRYFHLSGVDVKSGQAVKRGQKVGRIGSTGRSTGPHLHFQLERHGHHHNPEKVIGRRSDKVR